MKKYLAPIALSALLLAGCSSPAPSVDNNAQAAEQPAAAQSSDRSAKFGGTVTYESGVKVTVKSKGFKKASQYASGAVGGQIAVFTMTVQNGGKEEIDATLMSAPKVTYGEDGTTADMAVDTDVNADILSHIQPGEKQSATFGVGIPAKEAKDVRVEVTGPNVVTDKPAIFKGSVK